MDEAWKDDKIHLAVSRLRQTFGVGHIVVVDHWPSDGLAIGVERPGAPGLLAYLSASEHGDWFVSLESPPGPAEAASELPYRDVASYTGMKIDDVVQIVGRHLGLVRSA